MPSHGSHHTDSVHKLYLTQPYHLGQDLLLFSPRPLPPLQQPCRSSGTPWGSCTGYSPPTGTLSPPGFISLTSYFLQVSAQMSPAQPAFPSPLALSLADPAVPFLVVPSPLDAQGCLGFLTGAGCPSGQGRLSSHPSHSSLKAHFLVGTGVYGGSGAPTKGSP